MLGFGFLAVGSRSFVPEQQQTTIAASLFLLAALLTGGLGLLLQ